MFFNKQIYNFIWHGFFFLIKMLISILNTK